MRVHNIDYDYDYEKRARIRGTLTLKPLYDRKLSASERRAIEAYLARKYRIHALAAWQ